MSKGKMSKKLEQAVQHANETNPSSRSNTEPGTTINIRKKHKK